MQRRLRAVVPVQRLHVARKRHVRRIVHQMPVEADVVVPFAPLPELVPHEQQLLARMAVHVAVQRAQRRVFLPHVARHLVEHRPLAVDDLVVREREDEVLGEGVEHRERHFVVMPAAMHGVLLDVLEHVVHPSHVPFVGEPEAAEIHRPAHAAERRRFLRRGDRAREIAVGQAVQLLQEADRVEVLAAAESVRDPLAFPARVVQIQHRRDRVDAQAVDVVLLEPEERVRQQEVPDLVPAVVEDERAPILMLALARICVLVQRSAVEPREAVLVFRKMTGHPVEDHAEPRLMTRVDEVLEILRRPEAARRREETEDLIAPRSRKWMLHHRQQLDMREAEILHVRHEAVRQLAVREEAIALLGHAAPRSEMHLVDRHRTLEPPVLLLPRAHPSGVVPLIARDVAHY